jgi:hypothetical protein
MRVHLSPNPVSRYAGTMKLGKIFGACEELGQRVQRNAADDTSGRWRRPLLNLTQSQVYLRDNEPLDFRMEVRDGTPAVPLKDIEHGTPKASGIARQPKEKENARQEALQDLKRLLDLKGEQKRKYGKLLKPGKDFHRRHLMVASFLMLQQRKHEFQNCRRRDLAGNCRKELRKEYAFGFKNCAVGEVLG